MRKINVYFIKFIVILKAIRHPSTMQIEHPFINFDIV